MYPSQSNLLISMHVMTRRCVSYRAKYKPCFPPYTSNILSWNNFVTQIYNIVEQVCVCLSGCLKTKINATGVGSEEPDKVRERMGVAKLNQMKFRQMTIHVSLNVLPKKVSPPPPPLKKEEVSACTQTIQLCTHSHI